MTGTRSRGFSLLEVLVAFSIMALVLGTIYQVSGSSVRLAGGLERKTYALMMAQSLLDSHTTVPHADWSNQGRTGDGFEWQLSSRPLMPKENGLPALHELHVKVIWADGFKTSYVDVMTIVPELPPPLEALP